MKLKISSERALKFLAHGLRSDKKHLLFARLENTPKKRGHSGAHRPALDHLDYGLFCAMGQRAFLAINLSFLCAPVTVCTKVVEARTLVFCAFHSNTNV
uniref:Uncharacterized protein n=1 Tax=Romanomermis culicivorax TaxID=13658 RepID=A0A915ILF0_ROMCU